MSDAKRISLARVGMTTVFFLIVGCLAVIVVAAYLFAYWDRNGNALSQAANIAQVVGVLGVVIAIGALLFAKIQIDAGRELQRREFAYALYRDYLQKAFENPVLADPTEKLKKFDYVNRTIGTGPDADELFAKYEWYLSFVLDACDRLAQLPAEDGWQATIEMQIGYHWEYLASERCKNLGVLTQFDGDFLKLINSVVERKKREVARSIPVGTAAA